jgi:hypothetical protein
MGKAYDSFLRRTSAHENRAGNTASAAATLAMLRTTPALLALFSLVTIFAHQLLQGQPLPVRQAAWYSKALRLSRTRLFSFVSSFGP